MKKRLCPSSLYAYKNVISVAWLCSQSTQGINGTNSPKYRRGGRIRIFFYGCINNCFQNKGGGGDFIKEMRDRFFFLKFNRAVSSTNILLNYSRQRNRGPNLCWEETIRNLYVLSKLSIEIGKCAKQNLLAQLVYLPISSARFAWLKGEGTSALE